MAFCLRQSVLVGVVVAVFLVVPKSPLDAATETQKFGSESDAYNAGWVGENNRTLAYGTDFGFSASNNANGASGPGEAGGTFPRRNQPIGYFADLSIGHFDLSMPLQASGRIVFQQATLNGGVRLGWFNTSDLTNPLPAFAGVQIAEANRHQAVVILNDRTGRDAIFQTGGIGPVSTPFSLAWNPTTRSLTATIGSVTNFTSMMNDAQMGIGADFNAFGLYTGYTGSNDPGFQGRLWIDDVTYTSQDTAAAQLRINRYTGATRIVGSGGSTSVELDSYSAASNPANPPMENVWLPANWNSVTDQIGGTWIETSATAQQLSEANAAGSKTIAAGGRINLGNVFNTSSASEDITFNYSLTGESFNRPGQVVFDGGLLLRVNKQSGNITIINGEALNFSVDGYVIQSSSGVLNAGTWNSLQQQSLVGWETIATSDSGELSELNLDSSTPLAANGSLDLGAAYGGDMSGAQDLRFTFSLAGGQQVLEGEVQYVTALAGDYNSNGAVDAADYTIWRNTLSSTTDLRADGNANNIIDAGDYQTWKSHFGQQVGAGASHGALASIPEPTSSVLLVAAFIAHFVVPLRRNSA